MAIPLSVGDVLEVSFEGRLAGQQVMCLHHYKVREGEQADFDNWVQTSFGPWLEDAGHPYNLFVNAISSAVDALGIFVQIIFPQRRRYVSYTPLDTAGLLGPAALPPNDGAAVIKRGDLARRDNIGVMHVPGIPVVDVTDGIISAPQVGRLQALADSLALVYEPGGGQPVMDPILFHREEPPSGARVTAGFAADTIRVMRRRTVGLGS